MGNKITLTKPELIDFIAETVKDIISTKQQEKILDEQGFLSGLFGDEGTITPYKPDEAETDIDLKKNIFYQKNYLTHKFKPRQVASNLQYQCILK